MTERKRQDAEEFREFSRNVERLLTVVTARSFGDPEDKQASDPFPKSLARFLKIAFRVASECATQLPNHLACLHGIDSPPHEVVECAGIKRRTAHEAIIQFGKFAVGTVWQAADSEHYFKFWHPVFEPNQPMSEAELRELLQTVCSEFADRLTAEWWKAVIVSFCEVPRIEEDSLRVLIHGERADGLQRLGSEAQAAATTDPPIPTPQPLVELHGVHEQPIVCGRPVNRLTAPRYRVVEALLAAWPHGLSYEELRRIKADGPRYLNELCGASRFWKQAIAMPGHSRTGYAIRTSKGASPKFIVTP